MKKLRVQNNILERIKTELKKEAFTSYDNYNFWQELNISREEYKTIKELQYTPDNSNPR